MMVLHRTFVEASSRTGAEFLVAEVAEGRDNMEPITTNAKKADGGGVNEGPAVHRAKQAPQKSGTEIRKTVVDEFMLKEYTSIAAAHFDSQGGLRQQFRFYLLLAAVPLTILGLAFKDQQPNDIDRLDLLSLPHFLYYIFFAVGILGVFMLLVMIHTAQDATLYARTVNGIRAFFSERSRELGTDLSPYLVMPTDKDKPKYFRFRSFFWLAALIAAWNTAYIGIPASALWGHPITLSLCTFVPQLAMYPTFCWFRERRERVLGTPPT